MLENFIYSKTKSLFERTLNNGEVLDEAIVFIEDTKEIWNHGTYFDGSTFDPTDIEASILNILDTKLDTISDLETIRSGAALGATAVQPAAIADMETKTNAADTYLVKGDYALKSDVDDVDKKIYVFNYGNKQYGTLTLEEYDAILVADVVVFSEFSAPFNVKTFNGDLGILMLTVTSDNNIITYTIIINNLNWEMQTTLLQIPTSTSQLTNDSGYITSGELPTKVSQLENDVPYAVDEAIPENGVYAVRADGSLCTVEEADELCVAVALIQDEHKFMIEKTQSYDATNTTFYWGKNLYQKNVAGITEISTGYGYLPKADGTYQSTPNLSSDYTTWTSGGLSDFNGKNNTNAIITAYTEHSVDMDARDMCKVLQTFNAGTYGSNQGFTDWYIPACGQLALIYLNKTAINEALTAIGGTTFSDDYYWSSSEYSSGGGWSVNFFNGYVNGGYLKGNPNRVRFVRDFTPTKPLKERVKELELNYFKWSTIVKLITFSINDVEYQAEEGMTWGDWITSSTEISELFEYYDTGAIYPVGKNYLVDSSGSGVGTTAIIVNNGVYTSSSSPS